MVTLGVVQTADVGVFPIVAPRDTFTATSCISPGNTFAPDPGVTLGVNPAFDIAISIVSTPTGNGAPTISPSIALIPSPGVVPLESS